MRMVVLAHLVSGIAAAACMGFDRHAVAIIVALAEQLI